MDSHAVLSKQPKAVSSKQGSCPDSQVPLMSAPKDTEDLWAGL